MEKVNIVLPSDSNPDLYPDQPANKFKVRLSQPVHLDTRGDWEVALVNLKVPTQLSPSMTSGEECLIQVVKPNGDVSPPAKFGGLQPCESLQLFLAEFDKKLHSLHDIPDVKKPDEKNWHRSTNVKLLKDKDGTYFNPPRIEFLYNTVNYKNRPTLTINEALARYLQLPTSHRNAFTSQVDGPESSPLWMEIKRYHNNLVYASKVYLPEQVNWGLWHLLFHRLRDFVTEVKAKGHLRPEDDFLIQAVVTTFDLRIESKKNTQDILEFSVSSALALKLNWIDSIDPCDTPSITFRSDPKASNGEVLPSEHSKTTNITSQTTASVLQRDFRSKKSMPEHHRAQFINFTKIVTLPNAIDYLQQQKLEIITPNLLDNTRVYSQNGNDVLRVLNRERDEENKNAGITNIPIKKPLYKTIKKGKHRLQDFEVEIKNECQQLVPFSGVGKSVLHLSFQPAKRHRVSHFNLRIPCQKNVELKIPVNFVEGDVWKVKLYDLHYPLKWNNIKQKEMGVSYDGGNLEYLPAGFYYDPEETMKSVDALVKKVSQNEIYFQQQDNKYGDKDGKVSLFVPSTAKEIIFNKAIMNLLGGFEAATFSPSAVATKDYSKTASGNGWVFKFTYAVDVNQSFRLLYVYAPGLVQRTHVGHSKVELLAVINPPLINAENQGKNQEYQPFVTQPVSLKDGMRQLVRLRVDILDSIGRLVEFTSSSNPPEVTLHFSCNND